jgi:hypothetical protein
VSEKLTPASLPIRPMMVLHRGPHRYRLPVTKKDVISWLDRNGRREAANRQSGSCVIRCPRPVTIYEQPLLQSVSVVRLTATSAYILQSAVTPNVIA